MDVPPPMTGQPGTPSPVTVIFFFFVMFFWVSPGGNGNIASGRTISAEDYLHQRLAREAGAQNVLNSTQWGDFSPKAILNGTGAGNEVGSGWLNITGFRQSDGFSWGRMKKVNQRFDVFRKANGPPPAQGDEDSRDPAMFGVYHNARGFAEGPWVRSQGLGFENQFEGGHHLSLSKINPDANWAWHGLNRNVTGSDGRATLRISQFNPQSIASKHFILLNHTDASQPRLLSAELVLRDESNYGGWDMQLYGLQWPETGIIAMTTMSDKFDGLYGLPHLLNSQDLFNSSRSLLGKTLSDALEYRKQGLGYRRSDFWSEDDPLNPSPHCEYVVLIQVHSIAAQPKPSHAETMQQEILELEKQLRYPDGMPHISPPPLRMSFVAFSPDCDFVLESKGPPSYVPAEGHHLKGFKSEVYISKLKSLLLLYAGVLLLQAYLLLQQSKEASTPSTAARVSIIGIAMMVFVDFVVGFATMMTGAAADAVYPVVYITGFASFVGVMLGFRFIGDIYRFQAPERIEAQRERARAAAIREAPAVAARVQYWNRRAQLGLPIPQVLLEQGIITADGVRIPVEQPARPLAADSAQGDDQLIIVPSDQDVDAEITQNDPAAANAAAGLPAPATATLLTSRGERATMEFTSMFAPFFMLGTLFFLITVSSLNWSPFYRHFYLNTLALSYLSMWWPQIVRNVQRVHRKALRKRFVIGQSVLRLLPLAYVFCWEDNLAFAQTSWTTFGALMAWVWIQIVVLTAQETVGARLGVDKHLSKIFKLKDAWDYHPILREDDAEEGGMPIGLVLNSEGESPTLSRSNIGDQSRSKKSDAGHSRSVDCAICMNILEVPVVASGDKDKASTGGVQGMLERRKYMVTPCKHIFHSQCLEGWMRQKLACPVCRKDLPGL